MITGSAYVLTSGITIMQQVCYADEALLWSQRPCIRHHKLAPMLTHLEPDLQVEGPAGVACGHQQAQGQAAVHTATEQHSYLQLLVGLASASSAAGISHVRACV